ncbi:hypothetical protein NKH18_51260 [Streptomyces sp. M10(2022)]
MDCPPTRSPPTSPRPPAPLRPDRREPHGRLAVRGGEERTLLLVLHHSAADGWSLRPSPTTWPPPTRRARGPGPVRDPLPVQYADFAGWQRALLAPDPDGAGQLERLTAHWRRALAGLPEACTVPGDRPARVPAR